MQQMLYLADNKGGVDVDTTSSGFRFYSHGPFVILREHVCVVTFAPILLAVHNLRIRIQEISIYDNSKDTLCGFQFDSTTANYHDSGSPSQPKNFPP